LLHDLGSKTGFFKKLNATKSSPIVVDRMAQVKLGSRSDHLI